MAESIRGFGDVESVVRLVRREFDEMPGLALTVDQARRLWALEPRTCSTVLSVLVDTGYLCVTGDGHYARPSAA